VKQVADIMSEITAASQEQSESIEQVNAAISQMDEMTQQNAALVEQATAASQSMVDQANDMAQLVSFFSVGQMASAAGLGQPHNSGGVAAVKIQPKKSKAVKPVRSAPAPSADEWEDF
jgi:methyl-accepting chemotaxis protein